eukprot:TRINITY_DN15552_c0_g1_i2.p1 TRINITY_DN15552_c0_g1~~TRINITY_DN15552_c0_g1_i2.p1  ORF type:complete len:545 (+),score=126.69 TRINITY_DN15552_c0_g1_i2:46-1680(+)
MIRYEESNVLTEVLFRREGSVCLKAGLIAFIGSMITLGLVCLDEIDPKFRKDYGVSDLTEGPVWNALAGCALILLGFRTRQAFGRFWEGTSLLHQMRGEWFDSVACLFAFSRGAIPSKAAGVEEFRQTLVRLMSFCHCSALEEIRQDPEATYDIVDVCGLDIETLTYLKECKEELHFNRVEVILHMIQVLVTENLDNGVLKIPPPILSRVYQTLSRGFVNVLNCKKICDTMFPFPYTQMITVLLGFLMVGVPLMVSSCVHSKIFSPIVCFIPLFGMHALNFVARELEMPFGDDPNDLPLQHFQEEMNNSLMMLLHKSSDHKPYTSARCKRDFATLNKSVVATRLSQSGLSNEMSNSKTIDNDKLMEDLKKEHDVETARKTAEAAEKAAAEAAAKAAAPPPAPAPAPPKAAAPAPAPEVKVDPGLSKSVDELSKLLTASLQEIEKSQQLWLSSCEKQVSGLARNSDALQKFIDSSVLSEEFQRTQSSMASNIEGQLRSMQRMCDSLPKAQDLSQLRPLMMHQSQPMRSCSCGPPGQPTAKRISRC